MDYKVTTAVATSRPGSATQRNGSNDHQHHHLNRTCSHEDSSVTIGQLVPQNIEVPTILLSDEAAGLYLMHKAISQKIQ
jgi:hypothetical protein